MEQSFFQQPESAPSLLRQIVDEVDTSNEMEKAELLHRIRVQKALSLARKADTILEGKFKSLPEEGLAELVSNNRRRNYKEKIRS